MRTIRMEEIGELDGLFLTGTSLHVLPVSFVDDISLPTGNLTVQKIMDRFQEIMLKSSQINQLNI